MEDSDGFLCEAFHVRITTSHKLFLIVLLRWKLLSLLIVPFSFDLSTLDNLNNLIISSSSSLSLHVGSMTTLLISIKQSAKLKTPSLVRIAISVTYHWSFSGVVNIHKDATFYIRLLQTWWIYIKIKQILPSVCCISKLVFQKNWLELLDHIM